MDIEWKGYTFDYILRILRCLNNLVEEFDEKFASCSANLCEDAAEIIKLSIESGINDKNGRMIKFGDKVKGLFLFGMLIDGVCDFQNGAFGVKWMRGEAEEFTPFCCTHNIEWEIVDNVNTEERSK